VPDRGVSLCSLSILLDHRVSSVTYVDGLAVPSPTGRNAQGRLELLRDKAILQTLYTTALRRQELSRLNRTDVQDGRAREGLVTGKGDKERTVPSRRTRS
jgi:site-specific recombinase XerD